MELSIVIPSYKEAENLKVLLPRIINSLSSISKESEVLIVDGREPLDNTKEVCDLANRDSEYSIKYINQDGIGYGNAIRTGIEMSKGKYLIVMDADGSHDPADICRLYSTMKGSRYTVVIGSRYVKGGNTNNPWILILMSYVLNVTYRFFFHMNVKDVSGSYRIYVNAKLKSVHLECDNYDVVEEMLISLKNRYPDAEFKEIPIGFDKRMYGESKRDLVKFFFSYVKTIRRLRKISNRKNSYE